MLPTLNVVKQPYFGAVFYYMMAFAGILSVAALLEYAQPYQRAKVCILSLAVGMIVYDASHLRIGYATFGSNGDAAHVQREVCKAIDSVARDKCRVLLTTTGCICTPMITYDMLRNGLRDVSYSEWSYREKIDAKTEMESADIVIASEPGTGMVTTIFHPLTNSSKPCLSLGTRTN